MIKNNPFIFSNGFYKYFKNTSWLFTEILLRTIVTLFIGVWVARYLGPSSFGLFSYAQSFVALFAVIATLGLNSIVVRELVANKIAPGKIIGTAFVLKLIGAITTLLLLGIAIIFTENSKSTNLFIFIIASATIFQSFNVIDFYFQSKVLSRYVVFANIFSLLVSSIIKVYLILSSASLISFVWVVLFDSIVLATGYIYMYSKNNLYFNDWKFDSLIAKNMLRDSYPLIIAGVINSVYMKIDQVMIKDILNDIDVGYYSAAVKLSEAWFGVGVIICNSLFPAILNSKKISTDFYYKRIQKLFVFLIVISYLLSVFVYVFSDYIVLSLYGEDFYKTSNVLSIHIFSAIFVYLGVSSGRWLISENKAFLNLSRNIAGLIVNITLNFILIKDYGIIGAAYASLTAYILAFYVFDLFLKDTRKIFILKSKALLLLKLQLLITDDKK
ncbi:flippase [uncultured Polaribacter sp.]|uniref:flippase n=1 Tax=uncultured Polaribacter sp. TaxID=174711 RepID=UPI00262A63F9|nr:flippase [uncultured Polaribacter sp.]